MDDHIWSLREIAALLDSPLDQYLAGMAEEIERVPLQLPKAGAVVLFDWLMTVDLDTVPITNRAEKQALTDLLTQLEQTEITSVTQEDIDEAREQVSRDMGSW